ncbi:unnamed protein product [Bursaphelenchus xylophilus]|uniref:(pine wood nematode) hypothetical protein n=1 Tax=Bursaphelenchus xylophilus TaxID=6326 RepID=A0A1I7RID5_BURXY|nr:unnamed protein product [Bursaphelenchus xylophilus]CAG9080905.1 unnamed protein product [Bursaphelenchus xylophilus]
MRTAVILSILLLNSLVHSQVGNSYEICKAKVYQRANLAHAKKCNTDDPKLKQHETVLERQCQEARTWGEKRECLIALFNIKLLLCTISLDYCNENQSEFEKY